MSKVFIMTCIQNSFNLKRFIYKMRLINDIYKMQSKNCKKFVQWSFKQNLQYYYFLFIKYSTMRCITKRDNNFFVEMHQFIRSKDKMQCRTHHIKKLKEFSDPKDKNIIQIQRSNLLKFYKQNFTFRHLKCQQLVRQVKFCLKQKNWQGHIKSTELIDQLQESIKLLTLESLDSQHEFKDTPMIHNIRHPNRVQVKVVASDMGNGHLGIEQTSSYDLYNSEDDEYLSQMDRCTKIK